MMRQFDPDSYESLIDNFIGNMTMGHIMDNAFSDYYEECDEIIKSCYTYEVKNTWGDIPQDNHETALKYLVMAISRNVNSGAVNLLFDSLQTLVDLKIYTTKQVCESILTSDALTLDNGVFYRRSMQFVCKCLDHLDYKTCREIFVHLLEKSSYFPQEIDQTTRRKVEPALKGIRNLMNRQLNLMPAFFAMYELRKTLSLGVGESDDSRITKPSPHKLLSKEIRSFVKEFDKTSSLLSCHFRDCLTPVVGLHVVTCASWRLFASSLKIFVLGPMILTRPGDRIQQSGMLKRVLAQPMCAEMVNSMLQLNAKGQTKAATSGLHIALADLMIELMEACEAERDSRWLEHMLSHLTCYLVNLGIQRMILFNDLVNYFCQRIQGRSWTHSRQIIMWAILNFLSGFINRNVLSDFIPALHLLDIFYSSGDFNWIATTRMDDLLSDRHQRFAAVCVWLSILRKAEQSGGGTDRLPRPMPPQLKEGAEMLGESLAHIKERRPVFTEAYLSQMVVTLNAYSTQMNNTCAVLQKLADLMWDSNEIGNGATFTLPFDIKGGGTIEPLPHTVMNQMTIHLKMLTFHVFCQRFFGTIAGGTQGQAPHAHPPSVVETMCRLMVHHELDPSGGLYKFINNFLGFFVTKKFSSAPLLATCMDMLAYRLPHLTHQHRLAALMHNASLIRNCTATPGQASERMAANPTQATNLHLLYTLDWSYLVLVRGIATLDFAPGLVQTITMVKLPSFSTDLEELNKVLILTIIHFYKIYDLDDYQPSYLRDILATMQARTPLAFDADVRALMPDLARTYYTSQHMTTSSRLSHEELKRHVDAEYRRWMTITSGAESVNSFSPTSFQHPVLLCVLFKNIFEHSNMQSRAFKVLEKYTPRQLDLHLRCFCDYLVAEIANANTEVNNQIVARFVNSLLEMLLHWHVMPMDRFLLFLVLRPFFSENEGKVAIYLATQLLQDNSCPTNQYFQGLRAAKNILLTEGPRDLHTCSDWHLLHLKMHQRFPEHLYISHLMGTTQQYCPVYYSNIFFRLLPVIELIIYRIIEVEPPLSAVVNLVPSVGPLFRFHPRYMTFTYGLLRYYFDRLSAKQEYKHQFVRLTLLHCRSLDGNCLSDEVWENYLLREKFARWEPSPQYYRRLIERLVLTFTTYGREGFQVLNWRTSEFSGAAAAAVYSTATEIMCLWKPGETIAASLADVVSKEHEREDFGHWVQSLGVLFAHLPKTFSSYIYRSILELFRRVGNASGPGGAYDAKKFFEIFFTPTWTENDFPLALWHSFHLHGYNNIMQQIILFFREQLRPIIRTESQLLFACHLMGPIMSRLNSESAKMLSDLIAELYLMLEQVDRHSDQMYHLNTFGDFLYYIKYMHIGNMVQSTVERILPNLRPSLQRKLKYISPILRDTDTLSNGGPPSNRSEATSNA